jgi:anti-sigma B factor antagonist
MSESSPPPPPFKLETNQNALIARWRTSVMDEDALKVLARSIDAASTASSGINLVVLDVAAVTMMPSLALGLVMQISTLCKSRGQKLKLAGVQPPVRKVFSVTRLDRLLQFADSVEAAIKTP